MKLCDDCTSTCNPVLGDCMVRWTKSVLVESRFGSPHRSGREGGTGCAGGQQRRKGRIYRGGLTAVLDPEEEDGRGEAEAPAAGQGAPAVWIYCRRAGCGEEAGGAMVLEVLGGGWSCAGDEEAGGEGFGVGGRRWQGRQLGRGSRGGSSAAGMRASDQICREGAVEGGGMGIWPRCCGGRLELLRMRAKRRRVWFCVDAGEEMASVDLQWPERRWWWPGHGGVDLVAAVESVLALRGAGSGRWKPRWCSERDGSVVLAGCSEKGWMF